MVSSKALHTRLQLSRRFSRMARVTLPAPLARISSSAKRRTDATSPGVVDWWKGKFAWLNDFADTDLEVVAGTQTITVENPANYPGITPSDVPNELLEGSVSAWMNLSAAPLLVQATMKYTGGGDG